MTDYLELALERVPAPVVEPDGGDHKTPVDDKLIQPSTDVGGESPSVYTLTC